MSDQVKKTSVPSVVNFSEELDSSEELHYFPEELPELFSEELLDEWVEKLFKDPLLHEKFDEFFVKFDGHVLASVVEAVRSLPVYKELPTFEYEYNEYTFEDTFEDLLFDSLANRFSAKTGVKVTFAPYPEGFER